MRYQRLSYRYAAVAHVASAWPLGTLWPGDRLRLLVESRWRPDADVYETTTTVEVVVDLAGVNEEDVGVQIFEDALVVQGHRAIPAGADGIQYLAAGIRQGRFAVEVPLPAPVDPEGVEARYERGLLRLTLPKRAEKR
jgi:HSP20 family protein